MARQVQKAVKSSHRYVPGEGCGGRAYSDKIQGAWKRPM